MLLAAVLLGCEGGAPTEAAPVAIPGELQVGVGWSASPAPVGIGTAGYGGFGISAGVSPFADIYPPTQGFHNALDFRAVAISRGPEFEVVFLRGDMVGVFQQLRSAVVDELNERTGRDLDHVLVIGATHTHSGPGRVIDGGGPYDLIVDRFFPEFHDRMVDAMADAVQGALDDLAPGRVGMAFADGNAGINDRRCEDGRDYVNGQLPLLAIEQEGELVALHLAYAIHGTTLGIDDGLLSQDVSGGIEQQIENRFDRPVQVQMFTSWAGDMSPGSPDVPTRDGADQLGAFDRMERIGLSVADAVETALLDVEWMDEPDIAMHTWRVPIDRESIGYAPDVFRYDNGAVYCSSPEGVCTGNERYETMDEACIPFSDEFPAPKQTELSSGRIGDLHFVTFPGEPGTLLAESVMNGIRAADPEIEHIAFFGYSQDYLGYSILEDDWWNGGYEASGALWGPRQGEYLAARTIEAFGWDPSVQRPELPPRTPAFDTAGFVPYTPSAGIDVGTVLTQTEPVYGPDDVVVFEIAGSDPWLGAPTATLLDGDGEPVNRPNTLPVTSTGQAFTVRLVVEPPWDEGAPDEPRTFRWRYEFPVRHRQDAGVPELSGDHRFRVDIPDVDGSTQTVETDLFQVSETP